MRLQAPIWNGTGFGYAGLKDGAAHAGTVRNRVIGYVVAVNFLAYAAMVLDKARAENSAQRIPESTLLNLASIGGSIGTVIAQQTIRHKTRKEPFRSRLVGIVLFQALALIALVVGLVIMGSPETLWQFLKF